MHSCASSSSRSCGSFTGFTTTLLYWMNLSLLILVQTSIDQIQAYALTGVRVAETIGVLMNSIFTLFMGFNPSVNRNKSSYMWLYAITPQHYPFDTLGLLMFGQCDVDPTWNESTQA
ncbi:hypothetical protein PPTG_04143 [Phytophthora nicotianae INRA-310]|uniref:ABC-2 type transporter domain-containing protein n=1 Tax=Phytophthora nicotianae (strain INRA-310) TaxID=761204 RepID=W2QZP0_PHYN3|nr:hypothetical protein PPTG_04143 [Phytophthora nicotianae INRA-310]ETN18583.1 hypothetical protein PPTG_04143 [Phytophthora nicotianae INRA-310]